MISLKKRDDDDGGSPFANLEKSTVLQEARQFHATTTDTKKCCHILTKILFLINQGESVATKEATETFFAMTKLFQSQDVTLRRMLYLAIKEMSKLSEDVIIVTSSLTKDMTGREDVYRGAAIRALCRITDGTMLHSIERYMKQAIVDRHPSVASAALVSSVHLLKGGNDLVKRWVNEAQEAVSSDNSMVQYLALGLLYHIRKQDRLAISKLVAKHTRSSLRSPYAACLLIRIAAKVLRESETGSEPGAERSLYDFLESCLRHKNEMVIYEAARALTSMPSAEARDIAPSISVLQLLLSSPKPTLRFAAVRTLNRVAMQHPVAVTTCNLDLENLITDSNRSIATLAITTLLKTGREGNIDRLMKQISSFMGEISDEFKVVVVEAIRSLCARFPRKHDTMLQFLGSALRDEGGVDFKRAIVDTIISVVQESSDAKETALSHLCEYIEDCEHTDLAIRILHLLGEEGARSSRPNVYVRFIYNRIILENASIRAAAVSALAKFGAANESQLPSVIVLLERCMLDGDDEVRDRATFYHRILKEKQKSLMTTYVLNRLSVSVVGLERALLQYVQDDSQHSVPFDLKSVPLASTDEPAKTVATTGPTTAGAAMKPVSSRQDVFAEQLAAIPEFANLGPLFKSSPKAVDLTESETEYVVRCVKHVFKNHVVFQFDCTNTLNDQILENVAVHMEPGDDGFTVERTVPAAKLVFNKPATTYTCIAFSDDITESSATSFSCTLKFIVKDCDPNTQEPDDDEGYEDEYVLEDIDVALCDHFAPLATGDFSGMWEELGEDKEVEETYALSSMKTIEAAVDQVTSFMGMHPCERSHRVPENRSSHTLLLAGLFRTHSNVLVRARLAGSDGVTLRIAVRSEDEDLRQLVASSVG